MATAAVDTPADNRAGTRLDLTNDVVGPSGGPGLLRARIRTWPGRTIRYHETIPAKWDWSLDEAVRHWNESGGGIRFVESARAKARLTISYGDTGGAAGLGTLGFQHTNFVRLSPAYKRADAHDPETRVWVGRLFTHELGHVLGFNHTRGQCSLMYPIYDFGLCPPLPVDAPGYYICRWIDKALLRRFVAWYGGRAKQPPARCLIEALPEPLRDVRFSGGQASDAPVRVNWKPPGSGSPGHEGLDHGVEGLVVLEAAERLGAPNRRRPAGRDLDRPALRAGARRYRVEIVNRYGAGRTATSGRSSGGRRSPMPPWWAARPGFRSRAVGGSRGRVRPGPTSPSTQSRRPGDLSDGHRRLVEPPEGRRGPLGAVRRGCDRVRAAGGDNGLGHGQPPDDPGAGRPRRRGPARGGYAGLVARREVVPGLVDPA